jgi:succinate dehydrogenase / fumarate reductase membrane anchor subunit
MNCKSKSINNRNLGSAHNGTEHFIQQRVSSVMLIILCTWLVCSVIYISRAPVERLTSFISSPFHVTAAIMFIAYFLLHGTQGLQVVIEDYVHCKALKYTMLFLLNFVCIATFIISVVAILDVRTLVN